jgi:hypothetical protein
MKPDIQTEERKKKLLEFKGILKPLSKPKGEDVTGVTTVAFSRRIDKLRIAWKHLDQHADLASGSRMDAIIAKLSTKPSLPKGSPLTLDPVSGSDAIAFLSEVLDRVVEQESRRRSGISDQVVKLAKRISNTVLRIALTSDSPDVWAAGLEFFRDRSRTLKLNIIDFLNPEFMGPAYSKWESGLKTSVRNSLADGTVSPASRIVAGTRNHATLSSSLGTLLKEIAATEMTKLPRTSQNWVCKQLGLQQGPTVEYSDPSESPEIRQAASLLMFMYDDRTSGRISEEIFSRYRDLCEKHFRLFLRGTPGETVDADQQLHEIQDSGIGLVKIVRPRVDWYSPPTARVVIRAIVDAVHEARR